MPQKKPRHIVLTSWYVLYASWSSFQHEVPYNQCMEEHHHCFFYLPHCVQIALPGQQQFSATKKKQMSSDDATGKPRGTASNSVLCSVLSASQSPFQNDHQYSTQRMEEHRHTSMRRSSRDHSCTGPFTMLALKQRSHANRSFHDDCCVCWERFCTKIALEFWLGSFNQISRLLHHNRTKTSAHWSNSLHTRRANCEVSKGSRRSLPLSVPLSFCNVSVPISHLFSTKSEYYKNVAI